MIELSPAEYESFLRCDLMAFIERSFYELNPQTRFCESPHVEVMASRLAACRRGEIKRLIVNMPPRSLKSHAVSVAFPAWLLGHKPTMQIVCASYGQDLADKHARDCRRVMQSKFYARLFQGTRLSSEKQSVNEFVTTQQGFRMSTSVGGVLTGRGGDVIILDDPLKPEDALSETKRTSVNEWYSNTLLSRLNSKQTGAIIIVMQRLHQDDLVGHVLEHEENWQVLSFPAIAEEEETHVIETAFGRRYFHRKQGDALQPEREPKPVLDSLRKTLGEYDFLSQYQQSPTPPGGALIKTHWLQYYDPAKLPEQFWCIVQSWDTANKPGDLNDYSVCTTWGMVDSRYYLLHVYRKRLNYPDLKRAVHEQSRQTYSRRQADKVLIEDKASGTQLIQDLKVEGVVRVTPYEVPAGTDKLMRLYAQTAEFENGKVLLPQSAPWLDEYVRELTSFPGSKYDDQVDSTSQALEHMKANRSYEIWARLGQD
jgi:predicted phage terminase large subunit-like protein